MEPSLAAPLATIASAIATAILMYAAYHWPAGRNEADDERGAHQHHQHERPADDEEQKKSDSG